MTVRKWEGSVAPRGTGDSGGKHIAHLSHQDSPRAAGEPGRAVRARPGGKHRLQGGRGTAARCGQTSASSH